MAAVLASETSPRSALSLDEIRFRFCNKDSERSAQRGLASTCTGAAVPRGTIRAVDANCWCTDNESHRFSREGQFHQIAVLMNRCSVFVYVARSQINFAAAYPARMGMFELGHLQAPVTSRVHKKPPQRPTVGCVLIILGCRDYRTSAKERQLAAL